MRDMYSVDVIRDPLHTTSVCYLLRAVAPSKEQSPDFFCFFYDDAMWSIFFVMWEMYLQIALHCTALHTAQLCSVLKEAQR